MRCCARSLSYKILPSKYVRKIHVTQIPRRQPLSRSYRSFRHLRDLSIYAKISRSSNCDLPVSVVTDVWMLLYCSTKYQSLMYWIHISLVLTIREPIRSLCRRRCWLADSSQSNLRTSTGVYVTRTRHNARQLSSHYASSPFLVTVLSYTHPCLRSWCSSLTAVYPVCDTSPFSQKAVVPGTYLVFSNTSKDVYTSI